ncbi:hypothetical protein PGT21_026878 [Puccinia graminis f. sp. tritici]|uniref:CDP-diacylglycerol-glycerol-3-phosphate 3-phosphatidyltransferase n=1 Tax=Puccinia graminis f. sp. tritici TaxID=56615 RepID=A0A5B0R2B1_PUCGR|nr:hypothetical protein PGT21_026878 [Puccinia graminis f. sp. tritici]
MRPITFNPCRLTLPLRRAPRPPLLLLRLLHHHHPPRASIRTISPYSTQADHHHHHQELKPSKLARQQQTEDSKKTRENIYTIPNLLTSTRIILCPLLSYTIIHDHHLLSTGLLLYCALSDWLDGKLARMYPHKMASVLGTILDPAADKILMTTLVLSLSYKTLLPLPLTSIIIGRDLLLSLSAFYFRYQSLPTPKTFARFWDFSLPSAQVTPTQISKYNTFLQLSLVGLTTINPLIPLDTHTPIVLLQWTVASTTIISGLSYVFSRNAIRYIR